MMSHVPFLVMSAADSNTSDRGRMKGIIITLVVLAIQVTGQAPGDESPGCMATSPSNTRLLMDSNNYANLLAPNGVWMAYDNDGYGATWSPASGGNCQRTLTICEKLSSSNNWVFTQYISKNLSTSANITVFVNVTARFSICTPSCPAKAISVYAVKTNSQQTPPLNTTISNSTLLGNVTTSSFTIFEASLSFNLRSSEMGFYIAFRDAGSCVTLNRAKVYYYQCPAQQIGLVLFPLILAPTRSNSPLTVTVSCVDGAGNTSSLDLYCDSNGEWKGAPSCGCRLADGYMPSGLTACVGCGPGYWLDTTSISCQLCPQNSASASIATAECPCIAGYYRSSTEGPSILCTAPPTVPNNLTVVAVTNTSITLNWEKPEAIGRDDYYFTVKYRPGSSIEYIFVPNVTNPSETITYTILNLSPNTNYEVNVIAKNGVSDQDISNEYKRTSLINVMTLEGVPGIITDITAIGMYVIWQAPIQRNGIITGYNMRVCRGAVCNILSLGPTTFVYQVQSRDIPSGTGLTSAQVSAKTIVGSADWSSMVVLTNNTNCAYAVSQQSIDIRPSSSSNCPPVPATSICPKCSSNTPSACPSISCPQPSSSNVVPVGATPCPPVVSCPRYSSSPSLSCPPCSTPLCSPCSSCTAPSSSNRAVTSCSPCPLAIPLPSTMSSCPLVTSCPMCQPCATLTQTASQSCPPCYRMNITTPQSEYYSTTPSLLVNAAGDQLSNSSVLSCPATLGLSIGLACVFTSAITAIIVGFVCMLYNSKQKVPISTIHCGPAEMDVKM